MVDSNVPLEIQFVDPPGDLDVGESYRFRVVKRGQVGQGQSVEITQLDFVFQPIVWGQVESTDDPYVGLLRVIELVETGDVYDEPDYSVSAVLKATGATILRPRRQSRMATRRVELELLFLHGTPGNYERFDPLQASQPLDIERAFRLESEARRIVTREGRVFLECDAVADLVTQVDCKLPNSELVSCDVATLIDSGSAWQPSEPTLYPRYEQRLAQQRQSPQSPKLRPVRISEPDLKVLTEIEDVRVLDDPEAPLAIDFIDPPGDLVAGEELRFTVRLGDQPVEVRHLHLEFFPVVWASFEPTADPRVGRLRVLEMPRGENIYEQPELRVEASLRARGTMPLRPRRYVRMIPGQVELELVFYRGHGANFELFNPLTATRKLDLDEAFKVSSDRHRVVARENRLYLQCDRLCDLKTKVEVTLPNGEVLNLDLASRIESGTLFSGESEAVQAKPRQKPRRPRPEGEAVEGSEERSIRERLRLLRSFIVSFQTRRGAPDGDTAVKIRERIDARIKQTRDVLRQYSGPREAEFVRMFQSAIDSIPDYLRSPQNQSAALDTSAS